MYVYIAGPFFNLNQCSTIAKIENLLAYRKIAYFSPRSAGVLLDMDAADKRKNADKMYQLNIDNIKQADTIIAVIDDRDIGTIWEIGYAAALGKDIITYTANDYGLNVMLAKCVRYHAKHMNEVDLALSNPNMKSIPVDNLY